MKEQQAEICEKYGATFCETALGDIAGVSLNSKSGKMPINGLRHQPNKETSGWYIYAELEFKRDPGFFKPLHVEHLLEWQPMVLKYLGLPPGWRFLIDDKGYEDVWFDPKLLD